jgi:hypothetical protein
MLSGTSLLKVPPILRATPLLLRQPLLRVLYRR